MVEDSIRNVLEDCVKNSFMFTAFDITTLVRKDLGSNEYVKHSEVNLFVKNMYYNGEIKDYARTIVDLTINGINMSPFVYYSKSSDASKYDHSWITTNNLQNSVNVLPNSLSHSEIVEVASEYRLNIPMSLSKSIGFLPYDCVYLSIDNGRIKASRYGQKDKDLTVIKVNSDGRIRIGKLMLDQIACISTTKFKISVENNEIFVEIV